MHGEPDFGVAPPKSFEAAATICRQVAPISPFRPEAFLCRSTLRDAWCDETARRPLAQALRHPLNRACERRALT
jgi:hypothetical protein